MLAIHHSVSQLMKKIPWPDADAEADEATEPPNLDETVLWSSLESESGPSTSLSFLFVHPYSKYSD